MAIGKGQEDPEYGFKFCGIKHATVHAIVGNTSTCKTVI